VPIVENAALGIAIMSYNGRIDFGLVSDYDALPDVDDVAAALEGAIEELATLAGVSTKPRGRRPRAKQPA
jgi:diacylglycerol O-acyltransferase / wax synthase